MPTAWDDFVRPPSPCSSESSFDEEEVNQRITPHWPDYRDLLQCHGFHLDTFRDVREFYKKRRQEGACTTIDPLANAYGFRCKGEILNDDSLCPDAGLPDNLFRGTRICDGKEVVVKAVHLYSREYNVIRLLSTPPLRNDRMNHTIPVLDFIEVNDDDIVFIVMEQWSPHLIPGDGPCCLRLFLAALRQCIEHIVFMHRHQIAHLDISLRNLVTDYDGHYAYIDFELSRRFDSGSKPYICGYRGTEVPPECEDGICTDPYKVDVWALGVLILRACQVAGYQVPELVQLVRPMLFGNPDQRPSMRVVLQAFDHVIPLIGTHRMQSCPSH